MLKPSLLRRMILAQAVAMLAVWGLLIGFILGQLAWSRETIWDEDLELMASSLALLLQDERDPVRMERLMLRLQKVDEDISNASGLVAPEEYCSTHQVFDPNGHLLVRSKTAPQTPLTQAGGGFSDAIVQGAPWRVYVKVDPASGLRVIAGQPKRLGNLIIWRSLRKELPLQILIGLAAVTLFTWLVARRALKPLRVLAEAVAFRDPGDLRPLEGFRHLAETRPLIEGLNRLFKRTEELLEAQRRFVADAAHELRTPLAVIGAQAHVLRQARDEQPWLAARKDLQAGIERAELLVGQLLSVARLDDPGQTLDRSPLDLARLAQDRVALLRTAAEERGHSLVFHGPDRLPWQGDAAVLVSALDNLLVNAIRYTPEGGHIALSLLEAAEGVIVEVEDDGPGIPPEHRETIFERFSRLPGSPGTGSGLGLAIVRQAVERHGGTVILEEGGGGRGLRAVLRLPLNG